MSQNKNTFHTCMRLLSYIILRQKLRFAIVVFCILISSCCVVVSSMFLQTLIDEYITPLLLEEHPYFQELLHTLLLLGVMYVIGVIATFLYNRLMVKISQKTLKNIRDDMFAHMQTLPIGYFDTHTHGDIMSHYTNDTDTLRQFISQALPQFISAFITIFTILLAMLISNIPLTIVVLIITLFMMLTTKKIGGESAEYFVKQQESLGDVTGYIEEMVSGQKVIKVFCHEADAIQQFHIKNKQLYEDAKYANQYANILMPAIMQLGNLQYILIAFLGGMMALHGIGNISVGMIIAFLSLSKTFCNPVSQIAQQVSMMSMALAGAKRIFALIDEPSEIDHGYVTLVHAKFGDDEVTETTENDGIWAWKHPHHDGSITYTPLKGNIEFKDVDFGYTNEKIILHHIELNATTGEKIAFVGATGAGKTTITNLINRFYDIDDGKIRYDGININKIKKPDLRHSLGVVLQDVNLFTGTIMENIRYGNLEASDEQCIAAAKLSNAHEFIQDLPDGYDTMLTQNGAGLSQGQRQLISIARVAIANPPVMILDEATSSIDTRTEALVQQGMDNLMKGRTVFVIAHRLSTVRNSNNIIVLDHGEIKEQGTHSELLNHHGMYYRLYTGAFELE